MPTATLNPSGDTELRSASANSNWSTVTWFRVGDDNRDAYNNRTILKFDLSSISADARVLSAKLRIFAVEDHATNAGILDVHRLKRAVVISQATWNSYSTGNNWQTAGGFGTNDCEQTAIGSISLTASEPLNVYKEITLDNASIREHISGAFANNGLLLKMRTENDNAYLYRSVDWTSNKPELVIEYELGGGNFFELF